VRDDRIQAMPLSSVLLRSRSLQLALGLVLVGATVAYAAQNLGGATLIGTRLGWWAPAATVPLHVLVSLSPMPSDPIVIANGALYGPWLGALLGWCGWYLAAWIRFGIGRRAGRELPIEQWWRRLPSWLQRLPAGHPGVLILSRYIPGVGGELSTLVPGARGVAPWRFAWCTAIAIAPYALALAVFGTALI